MQIHREAYGYNENNLSALMQKKFAVAADNNLLAY